MDTILMNVFAAAIAAPLLGGLAYLLFGFTQEATEIQKPFSVYFTAAILVLVVFVWMSIDYESWREWGPYLVIPAWVGWWASDKAPRCTLGCTPDNVEKVVKT